MPEREKIVIEAGRTTARYWTDVWRFRELLGFLAWRDVKVRYKQAVLGIAWAVVQPAVQVVLFSFVFGRLAKMPDAGAHYPMLVLAGLLGWQLFAGALSGASASLVGNAHLISKVYFPRLLAPLSALAVALVDWTVLALLTAGAMVYWHIAPTWRLLAIPGLLVVALATALGAGLWLAALTVRFRDFRLIVPFLLQVGMFVTPVGYRTDVLPKWREMLSLNPMTGVVDGFRWAILGSGEGFYWHGFAISLVGTLVLLVSGLWFFRRVERSFADVI